MAIARREYLFTSESVTEGHGELTDRADALRGAAGLRELDAETVPA